MPDIVNQRDGSSVQFKRAQTQKFVSVYYANKKGDLLYDKENFDRFAGDRYPPKTHIR